MSLFIPDEPAEPRVREDDCLPPLEFPTLLDPALTRLTVNLTPAARAALERAAHRTGLSRTDVANIALMLHDQLVEAGDRQGVVHLEARDIAGAPLYLMSWRQPFIRAKRKWFPW